MGRPRKKHVLCEAPVPGGCLKPAFCRGLCAAHYRRLMAGKDIGKPVPYPKSKCLLCQKTAVAKGLCWKHYQRAYRSREQ